MQKILLGLVLMMFQLTAFAADEPAPAKVVPGYVSLGEPLVLNLATAGPRLAFVQLKTDILVKDEINVEQVKLHIPALRHQVILMLSEQNVDNVKSALKREKLRKEISEKIRSVYKDLTGKDYIEDVLFSSFLVQ